MTSKTVNDWVVKVGMDISDVERGSKRVEKIMDRLAKKQAKAYEGGKSSSSNKTNPNNPKSNSNAFGLPDHRQLKLANSIDTVMRRAARNIDKNSEEFKKLNNQAKTLKSTISGISSRSGLERLNNQIVILREDVNTATAALRSKKSVTQSMTASINNLARSYLSVFAAIEGGRAFLNTGSKFDSLNASLLAASGSAEVAAQDFEFIKKTSLNLGVQLNEVADGFRQIGAAGRFSNLSAEQTKDIFLAATEASRAYGLSADRTKLVFLAFSQILSKGKVSQEELRRQLGEQLPGAMGTAARAMGVTSAELEKMIQKGIAAEDFLPKFSAELRKTVKDSGALQASLNSITAANQRFTSSLQLGVLDSFSSGAKSGLVNFLERLTETITQLSPVFKIFGTIVGSALNTITFAMDLLSPVVSLTSTLLNSFVEIFEDAFDLTKASKEITILSLGIRRLSGYLLIGLSYIQRFFGWLQRVGTEIGIFDEKTGKATDSLKLMAQIFGALFAGNLILRGAKMIAKLTGGIAFLAKKVWQLLSGFSGMFSWLGKFKNMFPWLSPLLARLANVASLTKTAAGATTATAALGTKLALPVTTGAVVGWQTSKFLDQYGLAPELPPVLGEPLGKGVAHLLALFRDSEAQAAIDRMAKYEEFKQQNNSSNSTVNEISITVDAPNADAREVATVVGEVLDERLRDNNASLASY